MYVTNFGAITPASLLRKKGSKLAVLLKDDIFSAPTLRYAMALYHQIYKQIDNLLYQANQASPIDTTATQQMLAVCDEIEDFFSIISGDDVFSTVWRLDQERGTTKLFRNTTYDKARYIFPLMMRYFDFFHSGDFTDARIRVDDALNSDSHEMFLLSSVSNMKNIKDGKSYARMISHCESKLHGLLNLPSQQKAIKEKARSVPKSIIS